MRNMIDIKVISKESIKPSSPTPHHLRHYQLSYLDQISPPVFMPLVLFYPKEAHTNFTRQELCDQIKNSLSQALTLFYPLAGRLKHSLCIDCNDEGAYYVEADTEYQLSDILRNLNPNDINKFLPLELHDVDNGLLLIVQVTFFDCGAMAIGVGLNHEIGDAFSVAMLLNTWSALARGESDYKTPIFGASKLFPPKDMTGSPSDFWIGKNNVVTKRLVFDAKSIEALRNRYSDVCGTRDERRRPTRVEALSTLIWNRFMAATASTSQPKAKKETRDKIYAVLQPVNLRTRIETAENYFGNIIGTTASFPCMETNYKDHEDGSMNIVSPMRDSMKKIINSDKFVKNLKESDEHLERFKQFSTRVRNGEIIFLLFTSLCWFPYYEADFGFGSPVYVSSAGLACLNTVAFFDTKSRDGIEAWVNLVEEDMTKLVADQELLIYAKLRAKIIDRC